MIYTIEMEIQGSDQAFRADNVRILGRFEDEKAVTALLLCAAPDWIPVGEVELKDVISVRRAPTAKHGPPRWAGIRVRG